MGVNISQAHLNVGNPVRISGSFGFAKKCGALFVALHHRIQQALFATRRLLRHSADFGIAGHANGSRF